MKKGLLGSRQKVMDSITAELDNGRMRAPRQLRKNGAVAFLRATADLTAFLPQPGLATALPYR